MAKKENNIVSYIRPIVLILLAGFVLGAIHAVNDNMAPKDNADIVKGISSNLSLEVNGESADIIYKCKNSTAISVSFDSLYVTRRLGFEFSEGNKVSIPFISFDRIYATVGSGLLLSWGVKDIYQASIASKTKGKLLLIVLGAISGYTFGYNVFRKTKVDCASKEAEKFFAEREKLSYLKKCIVTQIMLSKVLVKKGKESHQIRCYSLGKVMLTNSFSLRQIYRNILDPHYLFIPLVVQKIQADKTLFEKVIEVENAFYESYQKLRDDRFQSFTSADIINVINHIKLLSSLIQNIADQSDESGEKYEIKDIKDLTDNEEQFLLLS